CTGTTTCSCVTADFMRPTTLLFFFQAEDGIRDGHVTGVQTCALPIWPFNDIRFGAGEMVIESAQEGQLRGRLDFGPDFQLALKRSEERRVGKECRSGWWPYH